MSSSIVLISSMMKVVKIGIKCLLLKKDKVIGNFVLWK